MTEEITDNASFWQERKPKAIETKMLKLDWLYQGCDDRINLGFAGLVEVMVDVSEAGLATNLAKTLVEYMYKRFKTRIIGWQFIPFCVYFVFTTIYFSNYLVPDALLLYLGHKAWTSDRIFC